MKKLKVNHPSDRVLILIVIIFIAALVEVLWFYGERINTLWQQNGNDQPASSASLNTDTRFYIQAAVKSLYESRPVTDPVQSRVYFPEGRFYVPYSDYARTVVYKFYNLSGTEPSTGIFTSDFNINTLPVTFDDVPCIQRSVTVLVNSRTGADGTFVKAVKLNDGRTLNLFAKRGPAACGKDPWNQGSTDKVVSLLEQAKSY